MTTDAVRAIREEIQRGYGDATQTVLDHQVAGAILERLRGMGWFSPEEVRTVVASAGGRVLVDTRRMADPPSELFVTDDFASGGKILFTR
jgi:hypothetical protein